VNSLVKETKARLYAPGREVILRIIRAMPMVRRTLPELVGTLAFVVAPLALLMLIGAVGCCFPRRLYEPNNLIWFGAMLSPLLFWMVFVYEILKDECRETRVWEAMFLQVWLFEVFSGIVLGAFFLLLGTKGAWSPIIEDWEARRNFVALIVLGWSVSFFGIVGRLYIWAKTFLRRERHQAGLAAAFFVIILWIVGIFLFLPMTDVLR